MASATNRRRGRPSKYTEELGKRICEEMIAVSLSYAMRVITLQADTRTKAWGNPEPGCAFATYPVKDQTSSAKAFGAMQDWEAYPAKAEWA